MLQLYVNMTDMSPRMYSQAHVEAKGGQKKGQSHFLTFFADNPFSAGLDKASSCILTKNSLN